MSCIRIYYHLPLGHLNTYRNKRTNVVTSFSSWGISEKKDPRDLSCPLENLRLYVLIASLITFVFEYSWHQPATSALKSRSTWTLLYQCSSPHYLHRFASISHQFHIFLSFSCEMNNPTIGSWVFLCGFLVFQCYHNRNVTNTQQTSSFPMHGAVWQGECMPCSYRVQRCGQSKGLISKDPHALLNDNVHNGAASLSIFLSQNGQRRLELRYVHEKYIFNIHSPSTDTLVLPFPWSSSHRHSIHVYIYRWKGKEICCNDTA